MRDLLTYILPGPTDSFSACMYVGIFLLAWAFLFDCVFLQAVGFSTNIYACLGSLWRLLSPMGKKRLCASLAWVSSHFVRGECAQDQYFVYI